MQEVLRMKKPHALSHKKMANVRLWGQTMKPVSSFGPTQKNPGVTRSAKRERLGW